LLSLSIIIKFLYSSGIIILSKFTSISSHCLSLNAEVISSKEISVFSPSLTGAILITSLVKIGHFCISLILSDTSLHQLNAIIQIQVNPIFKKSLLFKSAHITILFNK
jgi:hypothetical protein